MRKRAYLYGREMIWPQVARRDRSAQAHADVFLLLCGIRRTVRRDGQPQGQALAGDLLQRRRQVHRQPGQSGIKREIEPLVADLHAGGAGADPEPTVEEHEPDGREVRPSVGPHRRQPHVALAGEARDERRVVDGVHANELVVKDNSLLLAREFRNAQDEAKPHTPAPGSAAPASSAGQK